MKKTLIILAVVAACAVFAAVAYAWWTADGSLTGNTVGTGTMGIEVNGSDGAAITVSNLAPRNAPAFASTATPPALNTQDASAESGYPSKFFWVHNSGTVPEMFYAWASLGGNTWIADKVMVRVWLNPADYPGGIDSSYWKADAGREFLVYEGPLSGIDTPTEGRDTIRTVTPGGTLEEVGAGQYAVYKILFWLDGSATNAYQGQSITATLNVKGGQKDAWPF